MIGEKRWTAAEANVGHERIEQIDKGVNNNIFHFEFASTLTQTNKPHDINNN